MRQFVTRFLSEENSWADPYKTARMQALMDASWDREIWHESAGKNAAFKNAFFLRGRAYWHASYLGGAIVDETKGRAPYPGG